MAGREFYVVIEKNENGGFIGEVPQLKSCRGYGKTLDELVVNMREAIKLCLKDDGLDSHTQFIGVYKVEVQTDQS